MTKVNTETKEEIEKSIKALAIKSAECADKEGGRPIDAQQYAQAALNLSQALTGLSGIK